jgi:hypothetical protein
MKQIIFCAFFLLIMTAKGKGQLTMAPARPTTHTHSFGMTSKDSIYVTADFSLGRKGTHRWLLGDHYRKEWITPVAVPVVDLDTLFGGVSASKEGGGRQTKTLRLLLDHNRNREFVIRSVEKYPDGALPEEFAGTIASRFLKDQISSAHPFGALIVAPLAKAAAVLHTNPRMVYISHTTRLKDYDSSFGNRLYLLEERPKGDWQDTESFGHSPDIISTDKLRTLLTKHPHVKIDEGAYLRARLLDILIGDWDRHEDQWAWAASHKEGYTIYRPIPKDRDQAFANLDGVLPWLGRRKWAFRRTQHFDNRVTDVKGLVWTGRNLDRLLLTNLTWDDWQKEVAFLQSAWSNDIIEKAVRALPSVLYPISGNSITGKLKERRDQLESTARSFYLLLARDVTWVGTWGDDTFTFTSLSDSTFTVTQWGKIEGDYTMLRSRVFQKKETKAMSLYGLQGDDVYSHEAVSSIPARLRLIGGEGKNQYNTTRDERHKALYVYDQKKNTAISPRSFKHKTRYDSLTHQYHYGQHTYSLARPLLLPGYNPDDGVFAGIGFLFHHSKWGHHPYASKHRFTANYAARTRAYHFQYEGVFFKTVGAWDLYLSGQLNQPNWVQNFYGLGNETTLGDYSREYNRVRIEQAIGQIGIQRTLSAIHFIKLLAELSVSEVEENEKRFVSRRNSLLDSADFERTTWLGGKAAYQLSTVEEVPFPTKGFTFQTEGSYFHAGKHSNYIVRQTSSFRILIPIGPLVFGARLGGATLWGNPQFFQYNQLSGLDNLRGYRRGRFAGKTIVYNNTELRIPLTQLHGALFSGRLGLTAFCDNGRVWVPGEASNKWHWGYGGGVWFAPFNRIAFSANMGFSKEDHVLSVKTGFFF